MAKIAITNNDSWFYQQLGATADEVKKEIELDKNKGLRYEEQVY